MSAFEERLLTWAIEEMDLISVAPFKKIPNALTLSCLTKGRNKKIWTYVMNHVRSRINVYKIKNMLLIKRKLEHVSDNSFFSFPISNETPEYLKDRIQNAKEKRNSLERSLSIIEERILSTEHDIKNINNQLVTGNEKCAFFESLCNSYQEKIGTWQDICNKVSPYIITLKAYQDSKSNATCALTLKGCKFYNDWQDDETDAKLRALVDQGVLYMLKKLISDDKNRTEIRENLINCFGEVLDKITLPIVLSHLKLLAGISLNDFVNSAVKYKSIQDFVQEKNNVDPYKKIVSNLKQIHLNHVFEAKRNLKLVNTIIKEKEEICDKLSFLNTDSDNTDFLLKMNLLYKLVEKNAFIEGNKYLEECLLTEQKTLADLRNTSEQVQHSALEFLTDRFYQTGSIACMLSDSSTGMFEDIYKKSYSFKLYATREMLPVTQLSLTEYSQETRSSLENERHFMWSYCDKIKFFKSIFIDLHLIDASLTKECKVLLNVLSFEHHSTLCSKWASLKFNLYLQSNIDVFSFDNEGKIDVEKKYSLFIEMLQRAKMHISKAGICAHEGKSLISNFDNCLKDWMEQGAQFIPFIKHDDKTLKMWLDILQVLPEVQFPFDI